METQIVNLMISSYEHSLTGRCPHGYANRVAGKDDRPVNCVLDTSSMGGGADPNPSKTGASSNVNGSTNQSADRTS